MLEKVLCFWEHPTTGQSSRGAEEKGQRFSKLVSGGSLAQTEAREDYKELDGENWEFEFDTIRRSFHVKRAEGAPACNRVVSNMKLFIFL